MTKFVVYSDGDNRPVKKCKRERDGISFVTDIRNLAAYGYLTLVKESDAGAPCVYDTLTNTWRPLAENEPILEGYI